MLHISMNVVHPFFSHEMRRQSLVKPTPQPLPVHGMRLQSGLSVCHLVFGQLWGQLLHCWQQTGLSQKLIISCFVLGSHARTQVWWIFRSDDDLQMGKQIHNYLLFQSLLFGCSCFSGPDIDPNLCEKTLSEARWVTLYIVCSVWVSNVKTSWEANTADWSSTQSGIDFSFSISSIPPCLYFIPPPPLHPKKNGETGTYPHNQTAHKIVH